MATSGGQGAVEAAEAPLAGGKQGGNGGGGGEGGHAGAAGGKAAKTAESMDEFTKRSFTATQKILREQRGLLEKARGENKELRSRIAELSTTGFDEDDFNIGSLPAVARLAEEAETFSAKIEAERRRITDAERKLKEAEKAIKDKKDFLAQYATDANLAKQVQRMRDALELSVRKFATEISENKKARQEINELRRERRRFKQLMAANKSKIAAMQSHVKDVVKESQEWLEERQEYANAIEELQHGADTAQEEFFAQCRELKHVMRAFDSMDDRLAKGEFDLPNHMGNMTAEQEEDLQKKVVKGKWQLAKEKAMTDLLKEQALSFEEAFEKLQVATGFAKIEDFVSHFIQIEELNFHRFQYMHSLNMDIDKMEDEIKTLQSEASKSVAENKGKDDHWQTLKHNTMVRVDRLTEHDRLLESQIKNTQGNIERLAALSREICEKIGISDKELADLGIHHDSDPMMVLLDILGKIENRAIQLSKYAHVLKDDDNLDDFDLEGSERDEAEGDKEADQVKDVAPIYLHPRAPSIREDEDGEPFDDVPLSAQYLRSKMVGKGEEFLRVALMPGEDVNESATGHQRHRPMPNRGGGSGTDGGMMKRLASHQPVPTLNTSKLVAGETPGSGARGAGTARSSKENPRISRVLSGSKTAR